MRDLPKVFANPMNKDLYHSRSYSYGKLEEEKKERHEDEVINKIDKIFKNQDTLYSIDCVIKYEEFEEVCTIIGRTSNNLITKNQKLIPIKDIFDISLA